MTRFQNADSMSMRRFLSIELAMAALCNGVLNIAMAHAIFGGKDDIGLFGMDGVAFDLVATTFFTGLLMVVLLTPVLRRRVARGSAPSLARQEVPWPANKLPRNTVLRGAILGVVGTVVIVPAMVMVLGAAGMDSFAFEALVMFKAAFGATLGVVVAPLVIFPAIAN